MSKSLTEILNDRLTAAPGPLEGDAPTLAHLIVENLIKKAAFGDVLAIKLLWDRSEGLNMTPGEKQYYGTYPMIPPPLPPIDDSINGMAIKV